MGMTTETTAKSQLPKLDTAGLIAQYDKAISSYAARHTNCSPRQGRINHIVDMLADRAETGDAVALAWLA